MTITITIPTIILYTIVPLGIWIGLGLWSILLFFIHDTYKFVPQGDKFPCGETIMPLRIIDLVKRINDRMEKLGERFKQTKYHAPIERFINKHEKTCTVVFMFVIMPMVSPVLLFTWYRWFMHRKIFNCLPCIMKRMDKRHV